MNRSYWISAMRSYSNDGWDWNFILDVLADIEAL